MISIPDAVLGLLNIVDKLREAYPQKRFTLDGRLVGDIGEILAEQAYDMKLSEDLTKHHDATTPDGRRVQIKATMLKSLTFPVDHTPDYYIGIKIHHDGTFTEIFNGPGTIAAKAIINRKPTKTNLHSVSLTALSNLNKNISEKDRIRRRVNIEYKANELCKLTTG